MNPLTCAGQTHFKRFTRARYTSRVHNVPLLIAGLAVTFSLVSCRDRSSDQEREDGLALRKVLRENECNSSEITSREFAYSERVKLYLQAVRLSSPTPADTTSPTAATKTVHIRPTVDVVDRTLKPLEEFVKGRIAIKNALNSVTLKTPLPIAVRDDLLQAMDERIAVDNNWSIRLQALRGAITWNDESLIQDQMKRCDEIFQAYGPPQNVLRVAADTIEEQLRLPWYSAPPRKAGTSEQPCGQSPLPAPSPAGPIE